MMHLNVHCALYEKAVAWIVRETKLSDNPDHVAGYRVVNLTAALFDKSVRDVALDVVAFAVGINGNEGAKWPK